MQDGFDEEHGTHFHLHSANGGQEGFPFAVHDKHGIARLKLAQIARSVMGEPDVGMDGARIDPEGAGGNVVVVFCFGVDKEGKGCGIAHEHALPGVQQGNGVAADSVPKAGGNDARDGGGDEILVFEGSLHSATMVLSSMAASGRTTIPVTPRWRMPAASLASSGVPASA